MWYGRFPRYVSVAEKRAKAEKKLKQLRKKNPGIRPVVIEGTALARTWWGKSWNINLERYADYSNRIGRGRSYVRHGAVLDLKIESGKVTSLVQGGASKPYSVVIKIKGLSKDIWARIKGACEGKLDSLPELLAGKFPKALRDIFTEQGKGLFPSPKEIDFDCSCPDWANMCKHVAATLYGIGVRLDEDPGLFFKLRKVKMSDLITQAVEDKTKKLLEKAKKKSSRVIDDSDLASVFGIEMEDPAAIPEKAGKEARKTPGRKKSSKHAAKRAKTKSADKIQRKKTTPKKAASKTTPPAGKSKTATLSPLDTVVRVVRTSRKGVTVADIIKKTGLKEQQIRNCIYRARMSGKIKNVTRGVYTAG